MDYNDIVRPTMSGYSSYVVPAALVLLLVVFVAYYFWPRDKNIVVLGPYNVYGASAITRPNVQLFDQSQVSQGFTNNFTFSIYIYVSDGTKPIFTGTQTPNALIELTGAGTLVVDTNHESAQIQLTPMTSSTSPGGTPNSVITVSNFMSARWNQLLFSVEGRTVDAYLNGSLVSSTLLPDVPRASPTQITLFTQPGFDGQVGYAQAWGRRLTMTEIMANYKATSDRKGKPYIPDLPFKWSDLLNIIEKGFCNIGICVNNDSASKNPLQYIQYEY